VDIHQKIKETRTRTVETLRSDPDVSVSAKLFLDAATTAEMSIADREDAEKQKGKQQRARR